MNEQAAKEWLRKAWHNLSAAKLLFDARHYSDVTAVELHYAVEKSLKSFLAFENKKIPKSHDLVEIYSKIQEKISFDDSEKDLLIVISEYHIEEAYPGFERKLPPTEEIEAVLKFAKVLFGSVCRKLNIDLDEIKAL